MSFDSGMSEIKLLRASLVVLVKPSFDTLRWIDSTSEPVTMLGFACKLVLGALVRS